MNYKKRKKEKVLTSVFYRKNIHVTDLHPSNSFVVSIDLYWPRGFFQGPARSNLAHFHQS